MTAGNTEHEQSSAADPQGRNEALVSGNCGNCHKCLEGKMTEYGWPVTATYMIVCPECGNKRCPKATDHNFKCSGSNEPGQAGSIYR